MTPGIHEKKEIYSLRKLSISKSYDRPSEGNQLARSKFKGWDKSNRGEKTRFSSLKPNLLPMEKI